MIKVGDYYSAHIYEDGDSGVVKVIHLYGLDYYKEPRLGYVDRVSQVYCHMRMKDFTPEEGFTRLPWYKQLWYSFLDSQ